MASIESYRKKIKSLWISTVTNEHNETPRETDGPKVTNSAEAKKNNEMSFFPSVDRKQSENAFGT